MPVIGIDIGTTGAKAIAVSGDGRILAKGYSGYALLGEGRQVEQDADEWIRASAFAVKECVRAIGEARVEAISLSTQGGSTVAVDERFRPLGMAWTWMDGRAQEETKRLENQRGEAYFYPTTGWKLNSAFDAAKVPRMKKEGYVGERYLTTLEYVNWFLTGRAVADPTNAAMRQLFNIRKNDWDDTILQVAGIRRSELPEILPTGAFLGGLRRGAAEEIGLPEGTPVYNGGHDQYCASIGAGATSAGDMLLSTGTTWVVMGITRRPLFTDTFIAPGIHPIKGLYGSIASLACSGASLQWYKNRFLNEGFDAVNRGVEECYAEQNDLFFYPYLTGANYPVWQPAAKGTFTGFDLSNGKFDFAKAIMEGVSFGLKRTLADFERNGCPVRSLKIMGGAAKSGIWKRIIAAVTDIPIRQMREPDTCALGAAMIAAVGAGFYPDYKTAAGAMVRTDRVEPAAAEEAAYYDGKYNRYMKMWDCIERFYR